MKSKLLSRRSLLAALPVGGALVAALVPRPAGADYQPVMQAALDSLQVALKNLERASPDKGGHRTKAMVHTKRAISEVVQGIKFANRN